MPQQYQPWFEKYPERFREEQSLLGERGFALDEEILGRAKAVEFVGALPVDSSRLLRISFPDAFPSLPPRVFDTHEAPLLRRHHSLDTRELCLFGPQNARWHAGLSSSDVLGEAEALLKAFGPESALAEDDAVPEPISDMLPYKPYSSILVPPGVSDIDLPTAVTRKVQLSILYSEHSEPYAFARGVVAGVKIDHRQVSIPVAYTRALSGSQCYGATVLCLKGTPTLGDLRDCVLRHIPQSTKSTKNPNYWFAVLFEEQSGQASHARVAWVFARVDHRRNIEWIRAYPYRETERQARIPALAPLRDATVALVGCGCLGSKIAVNLAASGVKKFVLLDGDTHEPYNSVRHELGISSFGVLKVHAMMNRLADINPESLAGRSQYFVGASYDGKVNSDIYTALSHSSLILDTTGKHGVSRWVNDVAFETGVPAVFASVTNGAWGGEVVRIVPGRTACWLCWNEQYASAPPPSELSPTFYAPGCNQPSFTGATYDTGFVANLASSMIVDTLLPGFDRPHYSADYIRWAARDSSGPLLRSEMLPVVRRKSCPFCGTSRVCGA